MQEDAWLLGIVFVVWAALAALYAFVPMFHMPGYAEVWGLGAAVFLVLMLAVRRARSRAERQRTSSREESDESRSRRELNAKGDRHVG